MIEIQELYKYYGDQRAVGPLTTTIERGEIIGLLGLNGAGKTTTLRILACDLLPTSGSVKVGGVDVVESPDAVKAKVGYLPDRPPLYEDLSVSDYLTFAARIRGAEKTQVAKLVAEAIELTELGDVSKKVIGALSHGYKQRVGIAQAIVHAPELVVLDEPISGLDPVQIVEMRELVKNLKGEHTVVLSSHILSEISETCDRILVINSGKIAWSGTESALSAELRQGARVAITVRVAGAGPDAAQAKAVEIAEKVAGVSSVEARPASEVGADIATISVRGEGDLRDTLCRALVQADVSVLSLGREQELESMFLELLGETGEGAPVRRKKKRRKDGEQAVAGNTEGGAA
ncbi:MAG TPA: ABC transporter ATP-binding protein [Polyangiaceae bacterium]|nr:ABC transporter ATP-binding protein [Polyangiaceae bacterium]